MVVVGSWILERMHAVGARRVGGLLAAGCFAVAASGCSGTIVASGEASGGETTGGGGETSSEGSSGSGGSGDNADTSGGTNGPPNSSPIVMTTGGTLPATSGSTTGGTGVETSLAEGTPGEVVAVDTALPDLPSFTNIRAHAIDDSVTITFHPVDGAEDYRVYELPADEDISVDDDGRITAKNAIYRCAGDRVAWDVQTDHTNWTQHYAVHTLVNGVDISGYTRSEDEKWLGFVYLTPGEGRIPVYRMGSPDVKADGHCENRGGWPIWEESRFSIYTADDAERERLLDEGWRNAGIVFYVPDAASADTRPVYNAQNGKYYYIDGPEADKRGRDNHSFEVLKEEDGPDSAPLGRAYYWNACADSHDVLAAGETNFEKARYQGMGWPVTALNWAGLDGETTLVVEALAEGCPYPGFFGMSPVPGDDTYEEWKTLDQLQNESPTGEVFINGQHTPGVNPKPIARTFIKIGPGDEPDMDWFEDFDDDSLVSGTEYMPCKKTETPIPGEFDDCFGNHWRQNDRTTVEMYEVEGNRREFGVELGQLWVTWADLGADVNGKFRLTPKQKATLSEDSFLHATMTVDAFTTGRRYPQLIISEQEAPVQMRMKEGYALVFQTRHGWPYRFEMQVCDHQEWDVNNQCPMYDGVYVRDPNDASNKTGLLPNPVPGEYTGLDRATRFDVFVSTKRAYWFLEGQPFACANLPDASVPAGPVTVTYADVLYHSGVDSLQGYPAQKLHESSRRHFDNLGFKSGVAEPEWDESRFPCHNHLRN